MKPFPPTLRERRRYIHFKVISPTITSDLPGGSQNQTEVEYAISGAVLSLFGEDGYAKSNFSMIEYEKGKGICRCTHDWLDNILVALAFLREIEKKPAKIEVLSVSGTLKTIRKAKSF